MRKGNGTLAWAALDLVTCLLLVVYTLIAPPPKPAKPPRIETIGTYAVVLEWSGRSQDDVDLYVRDPKGNIVYYSNASGGLMNLEHDDIPTITETMAIRLRDGNHERALIRGTVPGEYVVNVHMFHKLDKGPTVVHVYLWKLRGEDHIIHEKTVVFTRQGQESTAFRFTVDSSGKVVSYSDLYMQLIKPEINFNGYGSGTGATPGNGTVPPNSYR